MNMSKKVILGLLVLVSTQTATASHSLFDMLDQINRELGEAFSTPSIRHSHTVQTKRPMMVDDADGGTLMTIELPGFEERDIKVTVEEQGKQKYLTISAKGEKKEEKKEEEKKDGKIKVFYSSYQRRDFYRKVSLRPEHDIKKIKATYKNGLLKVEVPVVEKKKVDSKVHEIKITHEE